MRQLKFLRIVILMILPLLLYASTQKTKILKPKNINTKVVTVIGGKNWIYYPIGYEKHTIVTVRGPGKIKVMTRARFKSSKSEEIDYSLTYRLDGGQINNSEFTNVKKSKKAKYKTMTYGIPSVRRDFVIEVGMGEHTLELWRDKQDLNINARYLFTSEKQKKQKWISLCPSRPNDPVDLVTKESVIHYYRFSNKKPLKIRVIGPTTLRVLNRIENHYHMKGRVNYRLQVKQDGVVKNTYMLSSIRSEVTSYKHNVKMVPGKAKEIVISVPGGVHNYEIIPLDKNKSTVLGRVMLLKKDLKLEE